MKWARISHVNNHVMVRLINDGPIDSKHIKSHTSNKINVN